MQRELSGANSTRAASSSRQGQPGSGLPLPRVTRRDSTARLKRGVESIEHGERAGELSESSRRSCRIARQLDWCPNVPQGDRSGYLNPEECPLDSNRAEASTLYVANLDYNLGETEMLELFNSIDGVYSSRQPNVLVAVNFAYDRETHMFRGYAYFMYSTRELANFAINRLHDKVVNGRRISVVRSRDRLNTPKLRHNLVGASRVGPDIWDVFNPSKSK